MVKTWTLLGLVLVGLCMSDCDAFKFKQRKRQSVTQCCYPSKYAWKIARKTQFDRRALDADTTDPLRILWDIISTTSVIESIEIVDGPTRYTGNNEDEFGYLTYVENLNTTKYVDYNSNRQCFYVEAYPYYPEASQNCLDDYEFDKQEKLKGVNYYVFVKPFSSSTSSNIKETKKLYALVNEASECTPRLLIEDTEYIYAGRKNSKQLITTYYSDIEMGPTQERLLQLPDESKYCKKRN